MTEVLQLHLFKVLLLERWKFKVYRKRTNLFNNNNVSSVKQSHEIQLYYHNSELKLSRALLQHEREVKYENKFPVQPLKLASSHRIVLSCTYDLNMRCYRRSGGRKSSKTIVARNVPYKKGKSLHGKTFESHKFRVFSLRERNPPAFTAAFKIQDSVFSKLPWTVFSVT